MLARWSGDTAPSCAPSRPSSGSGRSRRPPRSSASPRPRSRCTSASCARSSATSSSTGPSSGLAFTPGGLRLASRAVELLGLQDRTVLEVREAGVGRRMLRLATTSLFAEYAAPGPDRAVRRPRQGPRRRAERPPRPRLRVAAAHPHRRRHDRSAAGDHRRRRWPARSSSTTRCSPWSAPDHPLTRRPARRGDAARADLAARPVGRRRRRGDPRDAAAGSAYPRSASRSSRATPPRSRRPSGVAA